MENKIRVPINQTILKKVIYKFNLHKVASAINGALSYIKRKIAEVRYFGVQGI